MRMSYRQRFPERHSMGTEEYSPHEGEGGGRGKRLLAVAAIALVASGIFYMLFIAVPGWKEDGFQLGFANGYTAGKYDGNSTGYTSGWTLGFDQGHEAGKEEGEYTGYNQGYQGGVIAGNTSGYQQGWEAGVLKGSTEGYNIHDPTYTEAMNFVATDRTDQNHYSATYTCFNFCADFEENAYAAGIRVGFVYIQFVSGAHSAVVFDTVDKGIKIVEPQDDSLVNLAVGQPYWDRTRYAPPGYDDTVTMYTIIW